MSHALRSTLHFIVVLGLLAALALPLLAAPPTTFYIVRHAEKTGEEGDVPLSAVGTRRAETLRDMLRSVPLAAVYATATQRCRNTAAPTAEAAGLEVEVYPPMPEAEWLAGLATEHAGKSVLIVGHSNTVPLMVERLGGGSYEVGHDEYDSLFIVTVHEGTASVQRLRFDVAEKM